VYNLRIRHRFRDDVVVPVLPCSRLGEVHCIVQIEVLSPRLLSFDVICPQPAPCDQALGVLHLAQISLDCEWPAFTSRLLVLKVSGTCCCPATESDITEFVCRVRCHMASFVRLIPGAQRAQGTSLQLSRRHLLFCQLHLKWVVMPKGQRGYTTRENVILGDCRRDLNLPVDHYMREMEILDSLRGWGDGMQAGEANGDSLSPRRQHELYILVRILLSVTRAAYAMLSTRKRGNGLRRAQNAESWC
jgi:hypothetical protein